MALKPLRFATLLSSLAALATASGFEPSEDGLYAVFDTSEGEFTATLYFEQAPITVANFVGLAENSISHFDLDNQSFRNTPFYNGIVFHRIIENFVIQAGSPDGTGTDGPGYTFADEIETDLQHNAKGILSMANAGPNTNGSQFFITLSSQTAQHLDGRHAVFGLIVDGIEVVDTIGGFFGTNGAPSKTVTINSITIVREGAAALAFNPTDHIRPFELDATLDIEIEEDGSAFAFFPRSESSIYFQYKTADFQQTEGPIQLSESELDPNEIRHEIDLPGSSNLPVFYHYSQVSPLPRPSPKSKAGFDVTFSLPEAFGTHTVTLGNNQRGTFTSIFNPDNPLECEYAWYDLGDRIQIYFFFPFESWYEVQIHLDKDSLGGDTAFMTVNDPFFNQDLTHTGAFSFAPTETP